MNTEEGCSATCCPKLSVMLVGKCRDPDTPQEHQESVSPPTAQGIHIPTWMCGPVGAWGSQPRSLVDRTKFTHQMSIEIRQAHSRCPLGAYWLGDGQGTR